MTCCGPAQGYSPVNIDQPCPRGYYWIFAFVMFILGILLSALGVYNADSGHVEEGQVEMSIGITCIIISVLITAILKCVKDNHRVTSNA